MQLNGYIDHTNLKATATAKDIRLLCDEAKKYKFYAVCVNGCNVPIAARELKGSDVKVSAVVGFPLGAMATEVKVFEAKQAIAQGADEIDMVINIGWLKQGLRDDVANEIRAIKASIGEKILKVIIEACYLTDDEKRTMCQICMKSGADFIKTSTGFGTGGATEADIECIVQEVGTKLKIKAAGGIKDLTTAEKFIRLGVSRLGTSSGVALVQ